jgi:dihydrofolate reductase
MTTIVVAMGEKNEIGFENQLLWHLPKDLKHFKELLRASGYGKKNI